MAKKSLEQTAADAIQKALDKQADRGTVEEGLEEQSDADSLKQIEEMIESNRLNNAVVRISRRGPMESKASYVDEIATTDFDFENIKKMYGGGEYTFTLINAEGKYVKSRKVKIDSRFKGELDRQQDPAPRAQDSNGSQPAKRDDNSSQALLLRMFEKQSEDSKLFLQMMMGTVTAAFSRPAPPPDNSLSTMMPLLIAMMDRKGGGGGGPQFGPREFLETLKEYKELIGAEAAEKPSAIEKLLEAAPGFLAGFAAMRGGQPAPSPQVQLPAAAEPRRVNPDAGPETDADPAAAAPRPGPRPAPQPTNVTDLGRAFELCVSAARRGGEVELYADLLSEHIGPKEKPLVQNVLTGPAWFEQLFPNLPDGEQLKPWLTELRDLVLEILAQPDETEPESDGKPHSDEPAGEPNGAAGGNPAPGL